MASSKKRFPKPTNPIRSIPFDSAEEAWFWFIAAQQAREDGARFIAGAGLYPRPCEPSDILKILDRLYRNRRLIKDHFLVLRHYGRRMMAPDPRRAKEVRAYTLWREALERLEDILIKKGIVQRPPAHVDTDWEYDTYLLDPGFDELDLGVMR